MVDDIRPPQKEKIEEQNKQFNDFGNPTTTPPLEVPHLYDREEGFVAANKSRKSGGRRWPHVIFKHASRKHQALGASLIAVLLIGGATGVYAINKNSKPVSKHETTVGQKKEEAPKPTTEASKLTGIQVSPELNKRPVTSIQIENSPDARPQSGLHQAGVIFEAIAEGGITRFNVSFQEGMPDYIGPVRSVRPYYAVLAAPFDPIFVHAGGSAAGLAAIKTLGLKDMDHGANGGAFRRVNDRYAPHNLYTSTAELDKAAAARGYVSSEVKSFDRKADKPTTPATVNKIDINFSSPLYNTHYDYDPATNSYKRALAGKAHTDQRSGTQLAPKVVVAIVTDYSQSGIYSVYRTVGTGRAFIFQDGTFHDVTWHKPNDKEQFYFTDAAGGRVPLNAGQTWISLLKAPNNVAFGP